MLTDLDMSYDGAHDYRGSVNVPVSGTDFACSRLINPASSGVDLVIVEFSYISTVDDQPIFQFDTDMTENIAGDIQNANAGLTDAPIGIFTGDYNPGAGDIFFNPKLVTNEEHFIPEVENIIVTPGVCFEVYMFTISSDIIANIAWNEVRR